MGLSYENIFSGYEDARVVHMGFLMQVMLSEGFPFHQFIQWNISSHEDARVVTKMPE